VLTALAALPISVAWWNYCTSWKTAVVKIEAFRHLIISQQGKKNSGLLCIICITKNRNFSSVLHAHSQFLCGLARFDLANRGVRQPVQPHTFYGPLFVFDKTLAQPHFAVVDCSDALMNGFYSPVLTRSLIFAVMNCCVVALNVFSSDLERW